MLCPEKKRETHGTIYVWFKKEEIEKLDEICQEINLKTSRKTNRSEIVRLAIALLLKMDTIKIFEILKNS